MSKRVEEDFSVLLSFLSKYDLSSYISAPKQVDSFKGMHKKLLALLIFNAEFKLQSMQPNSTPFLEEVSSDLLLSFFCFIQGMYKPAKLQLRCSIENFLKAVLVSDTPTIIYEKSVYAVFDVAKADSHFSTAYGSHCFSILHSDYVTLCGTVHSDPATMRPISALTLLPQYNEALQEELYHIFIRLAESFLGVLYLNYPAVVDNMHPENKKDFLDCLTRTTKRSVISDLYSQ